MKSYLHSPLLNSFYLSVPNGHELYVELAGNPNGIPVVFLHGGPGGCINEKCRTFFDPEKYFVILFDQRGTGKSKPFLSLENNSPLANAQDMEILRKHLKIEQWLVFGGSYGSTLALVYAIHFPERVLHLILRGIFLGRKEDVDWLFQKGADGFYPEEFEKFKNFIPPSQQNNLVNAYYQLLTQGTETEKTQAAKTWADWENSILRIVNDPVSEEITATDRSAALLEAHYFVNRMFWETDHYLLENASKIKHLSVDIFHGRFDIDCRVQGAYELKKVLPQAQLHIVQEGSHYPYDPPLFNALREKMDELKAVYQPLQRG